MSESESKRNYLVEDQFDSPESNNIKPNIEESADIDYLLAY
jgi:hypothetical protein